MNIAPADDLLQAVGERKFATVLADPPWQFQNRTGKMAPEHKRLSRYPTMSLSEITELPVKAIVSDVAHLYLWVPNALLAEGMQVMDNWGFTYKTNIVWYKVRKDGGPDRRGLRGRRSLVIDGYSTPKLRFGRIETLNIGTVPNAAWRNERLPCLRMEMESHLYASFMASRVSSRSLRYAPTRSYTRRVSKSRLRSSRS